MKLYLILTALMITSCLPADKKALDESNQNILAVAKHIELQDKAIDLVGTKVFGAPWKPVGNALKNESKIIAKQAEETSKKDTGIWNFGNLKNTIVGLLKDGLDIAIDIGSSTPYGPLITASVGIVTTLLGKGALDGVLARRKEKVKKEVLKRQHPDDAKKFDEIVKNVENEIKEGKLKV